MLDYLIRTQADLERAVEECGILPLFANALPGFSVEENVAPEAWFSGEEGVWEWKGPVIRATGCAYGKFLGNKAVFISREWFADFANYRRDGYDFDARFDDELASYRDKELYDLVARMAPALSKEIKKAGNYKKGGKKGFDTILTRLQAQCYVITSDFVYQKDRHGNPYGWGVAEYSTPEVFMGEDFAERVYAREPKESYERIVGQVQKLLPDCDRKSIERFLYQNAGAMRRQDREKKEWLVPSNPKFFNIVEAFRENDIIRWKQGSDNIREGDIVYMYVGKPYSAILYRCEVVETDIPYTGQNANVNIKKIMRIKKLDEYPPERMTLEEMKKYRVVTVRATRYMPRELAEALEH